MDLACHQTSGIFHARANTTRHTVLRLGYLQRCGPAALRSSFGVRFYPFLVDSMKARWSLWCSVFHGT